MEELSLTPPSISRRRSFLNAHIAWIFAALTVLLSVLLLLLPLPPLAGPALVVFIPALVAALLIRLSEGKGRIRSRLFSAQAWKFNLKWAAASLGLGIGLRLAVSVLGLILVPGYRLQSGPFTPLLLVVFLFAAGEEIGWRGFALPRLLERGVSPLKASILLGIPWALLHLPLTLPGKLSAGVPPLAQFLTLLGLSVITTWLYLGARGSILPPVLLHGGQNATAILNQGLPLALNNWLMALVYGAVALLIIAFTRGWLGQGQGTE